ncbi:MAG: hypothetical protein JW797_02420 [Bradymonadales bacterium]|nr:hypothetical protein [Bradymonadales bacterium]
MPGVPAAEEGGGADLAQAEDAKHTPGSDLKQAEPAEHRMPEPGEEPSDRTPATEEEALAEQGESELAPVPLQGDLEPSPDHTTASPAAGETSVVAEEQVPELSEKTDSRLHPWTNDPAFFQREGKALADRQPERAALMYLESAAAGERASAPSKQVLADVDAAIKVRPSSAWLLPLARRALLRQHQYDRALEICQREVDLGGENAGRAAVLQEAAAIARYHKNDGRKALDYLERALAVQPGDITSLSGAIALRTQLDLHARAAEAMEQMAALLTVPEERALFLYAAGTLQETRLNQPEAAESDYRRAVEQDRQCLPVVMALKNLHERRNQWNLLCASLEHLAELAPNPSLEARLLYQAGSLHLDRTGDLEAAARDLERATRAVPEDPFYLQRLAYVYEAKGHYRDLVNTLRRLLDLTLDAQGRASILTHIGWLLQTRLSENEEAIAAYRQALAVAEGYLPALQSLGTLYRNQGDYENLLKIYAPEVEGSLPANVRAIRCVEMGEILCTKLARPEEAVHYYRRALELDPDLYLAFWGLRRLLKQLGWHPELADLLAWQAEKSKDDKTRHHLLWEQASLLAGPLGDPGRAIGILEKIGRVDRTRGIALSLIELYQQSGRVAEMVVFLLSQSGDTTDPAEAQGLKLQAATELEFALEEYDQALEIYNQVLRDDPGCVAAIRGAGRIYYHLGRWQELVDLHYHELTRLRPATADPSSEGPDAPILLCRIGRILEENLGQIPEAIQAYSKALSSDPTCIPALSALERLVRARRQWRDLIEVLTKFAAARMDRVASADALCRAAEVADFQLGDLELAAGLYGEAKKLNPASVTVLHGLLRVFQRAERWRDAAEILGLLVENCPSEQERSQYQLELARIEEHRLLQAPDLELLRAAAEASPFGNRLRVEITRIMRQTGAPDLADWLERLGQWTSDPALAVAYLLESVYLREFSPDHPEEGRLDAARQAHLRRPDALPVIWSLERALWAHQCWAELGILREKEAQLEVDPTVRVVKLAGAAMSYLQAGKLDDASHVARNALNFDAHSLAALQVLAYLAEVRESWSELASICDRLAEACQDPDNRLECCLRAADLWSTRLSDSTRALASLSVALTAQPGQAQAFERAEKLLLERQEYAELSSLYKWRIKACEDRSEQIELLRRHARLHRDHLNDNNRAIAEFSALLTLAPNDVPALSELCTLLIQQEHWSDAATKLAKLVQLTADPLQKSRSRLKQAELLLRYLHDPREARKVLVAELADHPDSLQGRKLMVELCATEGSWAEARTLLEAMAEEHDLADQIWALTQLAEVARLGLRDEVLRARYEMDALLLVADRPEALGPLNQQYWQQRDPQSLVERVEQVLATRPTSPGAVALRTLAAEQLLDRLNQPNRALEHLQECRIAAPHDDQVHLLLGRTLEHMDNTEAAGAEYRSLLQQHTGNVAAYRGLSRVMSQLGLHETAAAAISLIDLLGRLEPKETTLLKGLEGVMMPPGTMDLSTMALPPEARPLEQLFQMAVPHLGQIYPTAQPEVLAGDHPVTTACRRLAAALGIDNLSVSLGGIGGARAGLGDPVPLVLTPELRENPGNAAFRFWVGRALATAAAHSLLLDRLSDERLTDLIDALCDPRPDSNAAQQLKKQLSRILPRKVRKDLEGMDNTDLVRRLPAYRAAEQRRADQVGLLLCRHPKEGILVLAQAMRIPREEMVAAPRLAELMRYGISEEYARRSRALWH